MSNGFTAMHLFLQLSSDRGFGLSVGTIDKNTVSATKIIGTSTSYSVVYLPIMVSSRMRHIMPLSGLPVNSCATLAALLLIACSPSSEAPPSADGAASTLIDNADGGEAAEASWPTYLPDGQPDVQGLWTGGLNGLNIEELRNMMETTRTSPTIIVDPPDGILPYHQWARARRDEVLNNYNHPNHAQIDPQNRGWPDGIPRLNYYTPGPIHILQPSVYVVFLYETQHEFRIVPLDGRPHPGPDIKLWLGDSRGHWEEDTLVVDVTNHNDSTRLSVVGDFHSDEMRVTERFTFVDSATLEYQAIIDDPKTYTRPWTLGVTLGRSTLEGDEILEYAGVEGEKDAGLMVDIPAAAGTRE